MNTRSKKLQRQLSKSLDYEDLETDLPQLQNWTNGQKESNEYAGKLAVALENLPTFLDAIESSYEQLESNLKHATHSLEVSGKEVEERNRALRVEVKKVSNLLNNMKQAVFTVSADGKIVGPVSKFSETVFGKEVEKDDLFEILYKSIARDSEEFAGLKSGFIAVYGEGELQWDLMCDNFPKRVILSDGTDEKILKVTTSALWDDNANVEQLMFIVEDITELEALNRRIEIEKAKSGRNMAIIQELILSSREEVLSFFSKTQDLVTEIQAYIAGKKYTKDDINLIFRHLHTIKGNARSYGLQLLSGLTHKVESEFMKIRESYEKVEINSAMAQFSLAQMPQLIDQIGEYQEMIKKLYSGGGESASSSPFSAEKIEKFEEIMGILRLHLNDDLYSQIQDCFMDLIDKSTLSNLKKSVSNTVHKTSKAVGKTVKLEFQSGPFIMDDKEASMLEDAILHMVANAIDHGIETAEERRKAKKNSEGLIKIKVVQAAEFMEWTISDDGRGVDPKVIGALALKKGLVSSSELTKLNSDQILQLLCLPGFSTKDDVSEISGRGVGLDVVRANLQRLNGEVIFSSKIGSGSTFTLRIPSKKKAARPAA